MTRNEEMLEQARYYHKKHPEVWRYFCKFALEQIAKGFKNYSARDIFSRIRWHFDVPDKEGGSSFLLNNNFSPFYSRAFIKHYPQHKDFFRFRKQISKDYEATNLPELTPSDFDKNSWKTSNNQIEK